MHARSFVPSDAVDQLLVVETLSRIYEGIIAPEEVRAAVETAWGELAAAAGEKDFLPARVARRARQNLPVGFPLTTIS